MSQQEGATLNDLVKGTTYSTRDFLNLEQEGVEHFRILVIGNANAGKTTILEKVCHAQGRKPVYLDEVRHAHLRHQRSLVYPVHHDVV